MDHIESLRALSEQYEARSAQKLLAVARRFHVPASLKDAQAAVAPDVGRQLFAPKPRSQGQSAAEAPGKRLQADLIDLSNNAKAARGEHRYGLLVSNVFTRKAWAEPLRYKDAATVNPAFKKILKEVPGQGKDAAARKRDERTRMRKAGYVLRQIWVRPKQWATIQRYLARKMK